MADSDRGRSGWTDIGSGEGLEKVALDRGGRGRWPAPEGKKAVDGTAVEGAAAASTAGEEEGGGGSKLSRAQEEKTEDDGPMEQRGRRLGQLRTSNF
jgi:hypothetical protein